MTNRIVTIKAEGKTGSGKTLILSKLIDLLEKEGHKCELVREHTLEIEIIKEKL